jgi:ElaB/YqjD/DUF883 family membrane-anchored ribosome-binding protein
MCEERWWLKAAPFFPFSSEQLSEKTLMKANIESISETMNTLQDVQQDLKEKAANTLCAATHYIEENPWKAIGLVAVCALALGFLLRVGSD